MNDIEKLKIKLCDLGWENAELIELCKLALENIDPYTIQMQDDLEYITKELERLDHG